MLVLDLSLPQDGWKDSYNQREWPRVQDEIFQLPKLSRVKTGPDQRRFQSSGNKRSL